MMIEQLLVPFYGLFIGVAVFWRVFRVWRTAGVNALGMAPKEGVAKVISTYFRVVFVGLGVVALTTLLPAMQRQFLRPITWLDQPLIKGFGWVILLLAFGVVVLAQVQMGSAWRISVDESQRSQLVTNGLFRFSRNPIFVAIRALFAGMFLVFPNAGTLLFWMLGDVLIQAQVQLEEAYLRDAFGDEYQAYVRQVRRWV